MKYDTTLKELLQAGAPQLWQVLAGEQPEEFLTVELPSVQMRKPDFLARLASGAPFHLELQADNHPTMEWRELEYYVFIHRLHQEPPLQCVLYFGAPPLAMRNYIATESLRFRYTLIDVRVFNVEYFLAGSALPDATLAVLATSKNMTQREVIKTILERFRVLPEKEQRDWLEKLMILSGLRNCEDIVREEAEKMGISLDIRDNKFWQEAYAAGLEDGVKQAVEQGLGKGEAALLQSLIERRFGSLPEWARQQIEQANRAKLEEIGLRLLDAARLEDVFNGHGNGGS